MIVAEETILLQPRAVWIDPPGRFERLCARVEGETIAALEPFDAPADGRPQRLIALPEHYLLPGLINTHVHLEFSASPTPLADYLAETPGERLLRVLGAAHKLLLSGVTTARDCGSHWAALAVARRPDLSPLPLPRLLMSGPPITVRRGHLHMMGGEAESEDEIRSLIESLCAQGATSLKVMASGGGMTPGTLPEKATYDVARLKLIAGEARTRGMPSAAHVLATESIRRAAEAGFDSLEHCAFFARNAKGWTERRYEAAVGDRVAASGAAMMAGLSTAVRSLEPIQKNGPRDEEEAFKLEENDRLLENFSRLVACGVQMVCGSDAGVRHTPFEETWLEYALMVRAGLKPVEAIRSATLRAARALLIDHHVGRIAPDFSADLIAVKSNPLENAEAFRDVDFVMRAGEIVRDAVAGARN